jgi:hypothetical protein
MGMGVLFRSDVRRRFVVCLAIAVLLSLSSSELWHHHQNLENSATCQICHVIHAPLLPGQLATNLPKLIVYSSAVHVASQIRTFDPALRHSSPRAPPAIS